MSDFVKRLEPMLIDLYLPEHIRSHMNLLKMPEDKIGETIKDIMSNPEKKDRYMKIIEELAKEES